MTKVTAPSKAIVAKYAKALESLSQTLHAAHDVEQAAKGKAAELRKGAINFAIDAGRAADVDTGDIRDAIMERLDAAVAAGELEKSSARAYMTGVRFALERRVMWSPALHSAEGQIQALLDAGKPIPKSLQAKADDMAAKKTERDAKQGKAHVASKESVIKHLAKALVDARALGAAYAADILDCIHGIQPEWKEPTADTK